MLLLMVRQLVGPEGGNRRLEMTLLLRRLLWYRWKTIYFFFVFICVVALAAFQLCARLIYQTRNRTMNRSTNRKYGANAAAAAATEEHLKTFHHLPVPHGSAPGSESTAATYPTSYAATFAASSGAPVAGSSLGGGAGGDFGGGCDAGGGGACGM